MKKYILILLLFSSAVSFSQSCPTHFLRNDTTIIIVCSNDKVNISNIYRTVGMSVTWNIGDSTKAGLGTARLIADSSGCRDTAFITIRQDINNWLGAVDSNWANPQNWSNEKIPDSTSNVIISPATNACILSSYASVATLQVLKDARFKILNNQVLKILSKCDTLTPLIELDANTIVLDTATTKKIQSVTVTAITFNGSTAQIQALTPGNIIVSDVAANAPNGFLRMITSIQKNGATTTVITTTVTLTEAFKELHINSSKTYYEDDTTAKPTTAFEPFTKDIDQVLYDADGDESTTHDQVKVTGKLEIKPTVNVDFDITKRSVKYAKMEFIFESKLELTGTVGGTLPTITKEKTIYTKKLKPLYTTTAPPILVFPELFLKAGVVANAELELSATNTTNFTITAFLEYKNGEWNYGHNESYNNELSFNGKGNADVKFYLKPGIDFKLYDFDWAKGTIFAEAYIKAKAQLLPFQTCDVKAGLLAGGDVVLEFLGRTFTPEVKPVIFDISTTLYECPKVITNAATNVTTHAAESGGKVNNYDKDTIIQRGICYSLKPKPTVKDSLTNDGTGKGDFVSILANLIEDTAYYYKAYAITQSDTVYGVELSFRTLSDSIFTDPRDGQKYPFKKIGNQVWMTKNMNYATPSSKCYNNNSAECSVYGRLYDWSNALSVAPPGWHLPTDAEWSILTNYVNNNGGALKDTTLWNTPNTGATNSSGFKAIAAGYRNDFGQSLSKGVAAFFWSSSPGTTVASWSRILSSGDAIIDRGYYYKLFFFSVRCIKD